MDKSVYLASLKYAGYLSLIGDSTLNEAIVRLTDEFALLGVSAYYIVSSAE